LAASGAELDFARVYEEHVWRVYGFLAYRVADRGTAEDLTQATFERALRAWSRFDPRRASVSTWLVSIARNLLIDHARRDHSRDERSLDDRAVDASAPATVAGPEQRAEGSPELIAALTRLPERDREVLALRFGADLSGGEIAALMGLSVANVHQIVSRALRRLREDLGEPLRS
jgi:RNA polymerase sigma-70 factor (ECF subfamily)